MHDALGYEAYPIISERPIARPSQKCAQAVCSRPDLTTLVSVKRREIQTGKLGVKCITIHLENENTAFKGSA